MILDSCGCAAQLPREGSGADIALWTNLQRNAAIREKIHERRIIDRGDAVTNPFGSEEFDSLSNLFWAANLARVDEPVQTRSRGLVVYRPQLNCGHAQLIAADAKGDDGFRCALLRCFHNAARCFGAKLTNRIE